MKINLAYASRALETLRHFKSESGKLYPTVYAEGNYSLLGVNRDDIVDLMASLLHLAQQMKNEGEELDPEVVKDTAWHHFECEVLEPDDIEIGQREVAAENEE